MTGEMMPKRRRKKPNDRSPGAYLLVAMLMITVTGTACGGDATTRTGGAVQGPENVTPSESPESPDDIESDLAELLSPEFPMLREPFTGDLTEIVNRHFLRVLVSPSRTSFFFADAQVRGFDVELMRAFETHLNEGRKPSDRVAVVFVPLPFEALLPALEKGLGDLVAAGMTVTPERQLAAAFSNPYLTDIAEVVVHNASVSDVKELSDLAGRRVSVRTGSSYVENLRRLSSDLQNRGSEPIEIHETGPFLATEDLLEMVSSGSLELTVADTFLAEAWARVMPDLVVRNDLIIHEGGELAFAVRKINPELLASLNGFVAKNRKGTVLGNILFTRYFDTAKWLKNPSEPAASKSFQKLVTVFQTYGQQYGFDWLGIGAQAFQESGFDQSKKSRAGAVGMMQIRPETAADKHVGISDVTKLENNVHAGVKYLAFLRDHYFSDDGLDDQERVNFALAAYNAGPKRIVAARTAAPELGLDPNQWFFNVEHIVSRTVGRETVDYVRNIRAYWVAFKLMYEENQRRQGERNKD